MRCAVVGSPISHSLSPAMHRAAYRQLGLDWSYGAFDVQDGELTEFVSEHREGWRGYSVTAPLKREAAGLAAVRDPYVEALGVANTLVAIDGGWSAHNTDVPGAVSALHEIGVGSLRSVRIVGAGATAASMALACRRLGAREVELRVRDTARAASTARTIEGLGLAVTVVPLHVEVLESVDLLVNTVPDGSLAGREHGFVGATNAVFDAVYDPWPTALMRSARSEGRSLATGLDLLGHQAVLQVSLMAGDTVEPAVLVTAAMEALASR
ncbi:shikimate dehydrogenase family protein [Aeromicrobium choanae]|uniref:Shikimate dehydrogenase n=1 Tax=Aeromicrobium choanae TaxID=1736691 RepID=A0A1T4Z8P2_9ACTN|nr:shikimate dehydrogenase [Aeromicrobium choanae]SKB09971.1 shikimate dehydrogenase [Aeromicrobium choanae]